MTSDNAKEAFKASIRGAVREKCTELTNQKGSIGYNDGKNIVEFVEMVFMKYTHTVPKQVKAACQLALATIAPSITEKKKLIKAVATSMSGIGGLAAIITGIGMALGWGTGVMTAVIAWFTGASMLGPIGWIFAGASLTVCAGYFYFSSDDAKDAERFENALIGGLEKAIDEIWNNHGSELEVALLPYKD